MPPRVIELRAFGPVEAVTYGRWHERAQGIHVVVFRRIISRVGVLDRGDGLEDGAQRSEGGSVGDREANEDR